MKEIAVLKEPKFKPRNVNDAIPPIFPYNVWLRNCSVTGGGGGFAFQNIDGIIAQNLRTRNTERPLTIRRGKRVYLDGLDFQR